MPSGVTGFVVIQRLLRGLGDAVGGFLDISDVADRALRPGLLQQLLRFEIGDRCIVLMKGTEHHANGLGPDGFGDPVSEEFISTISHFAPVQGHERHRLADPLKDEADARKSGSTISFTGVIPPPMHGWPKGGVISMSKVESRELRCFEGADGRGTARQSKTSGNRIASSGVHGERRRGKGKKEQSHTLPRISCPKHPVQHRLDLERLQVRLQRQDAGGDAGQVRRRPARRRLAGERAEIATAVRLELHLLAQLVREPQRVVEQPLVHRDERRGERGRVAARERVLVVRRGEDQHVAEVRLLDGPQELLPPRQLLQLVLRHARATG